MKYRKGESIRTFRHLLAEWEGQGRVIYVPNRKTYGPEWMIKLLVKFIKSGVFYESREVKHGGRK